MIFAGDDKVRLTPDEVRSLRRAAARNGDVVGAVKTSRELAEAVAAALPDQALEACDTFARRRARGPEGRPK